MHICSLLVSYCPMRSQLYYTVNESSINLNDKQVTQINICLLICYVSLSKSVTHKMNLI